MSQALIKTDSQGKQAFYVYGLGLIGQDEDSVYKTYHYDLRGSTIELSDSSGTITDRFQYGPYGELVYRTGSSSIQFLYNGRDGVMADGNGLYYMRARHYNPEIRRFVNQDIVIGSIESVQSLNRYAYVKGNPVLYSDPLGYWSDAVHYDDTKSWAENFFNGVFSEEDAEIIASADNGVDSIFSLTNPIWGDQSWHFDRDWGTADSRKTHSEDEMKKAKDSLKNGDREESLEHLGKGLHALQDIYAHMDYGLDQSPRIIVPHPSKYDDLSWDYDDKQGWHQHLTKKGYADKESNSRYIKTDNATFDYLLEFWYYEQGLKSTC